MTPTEPSELLESRLERLGESPAAARLRARLRAGDDRQLFRVNPFTFAAEEGVADTEAVELFLRAAAVGLFHTEWLLVCRGCGEYVVTHVGLGELDTVVHCLSCARDRETNLADSVEVAFTVAPEVREIRYAHPDTLEIDDYFFNYRFSPNILVRGADRSLLTHLRLGTKAMLRLPPGGAHTLETELEVGWIVGSPREMITVEGERTEAVRELVLTFDGHAFMPRPTVAPGPARITYKNATEHEVPLLAYFTPIVTYFDYLPSLSGQRLLNTNDFRRYLGTEVVRPGSAIPTRDDTLLFSDLRGSTELYDRIGDTAAFELVSAHLELLARVVTRHSGVIVKTIGDAVMASFSRTVDAVRAALEMGAALGEMGGAEPLAIKIGIHRGPCLVVNVRDEIDYFGQTVNIAARVQALAHSGEVCMTDAVLDAPEVRAVVAQHREARAPGSSGTPLPSESVALRGVGEPYTIHRYLA